MIGNTKFDDREEQNTFSNSRGLSDDLIRAGFVRKVFVILTVQLLFTFSIVSIFSFVEPLKKYVQTNIWLYIVSLIVFFVLYFVLICSRNAARKTPLNFVCLFLLTLAMGFMLGCTASRFETFSVLIAIGITIGVTTAMSIFAIQTKYDLTKKFYGPLLAMITVLFLFGIFAIIFRNQIMMVVYASLGALVFSLFIAFDVQMVVGGRTIELNEDDYIFGTLILYLDIVNLFMMVLTLTGAIRN